MKNNLLLISVFVLAFGTLLSYGQEFETDLVGKFKSNLLKEFYLSEYSTMTVTSFRNSDKGSLVEETEATYRKGKLFSERINFTVKYTEHYLIDDRKKSLGKYEFDTENNIYRYEISDINEDNQKYMTQFIFFTYDQGMVVREYIRYREYVGQGSVGLDSVITIDSVLYSVQRSEDKIIHTNKSLSGTRTEYNFENELLVKKENIYEGFKEVISFTYNSQNKLVRQDSRLENNEGNSISTYSTFSYSSEGFIMEVNFYDQTNTLLEKKVISYK